MVTTLVMSRKLATPGLKIKVFWDKRYDVIIFVHDVTNKVLSRSSNYILNMVMWSNFGHSRIAMTEVIITTILSGFEQKK